MRLLEFNKDEGGANPQRSRSRPRKREPIASDVQAPPSTPARAQKVRGEAYPIQGTAIRKLVRRGPIDLEQLQQRMGFLERRLQDQSNRTEKLASLRDIEQLRERMNRMENTLEQEFAAARAREENLKESLARPPLDTLLRTRAIQFWHEDLPIIGAWMLKIARSWWQELQPEWWPRLASAWKESLEKARR